MVAYFVLIMVCLERDLQRVQTIWHSSLIMEFWMNNVLRMQENNGCEVLHLFLQHLGLLPLTCSVLKKKNLANTGHMQLSGAASVSLLKIPLIIFPPPAPHLAEENVLHCFHRPRFWHFFWFWWYLMLSDSIHFKAKHSRVWSLIYLTVCL